MAQAVSLADSHRESQRSVDEAAAFRASLSRGGETGGKKLKKDSPDQRAPVQMKPLEKIFVVFEGKKPEVTEELMQFILGSMDSTESTRCPPCPWPIRVRPRCRRIPLYQCAHATHA